MSNKDEEYTTSVYVFFFLISLCLMWAVKKEIDYHSSKNEYYSKKFKKEYKIPVITKKVIGVVESGYVVALSKSLRRYPLNLKDGSSFLIGGNFSMPYFQRGDNVIGIYEDDRLDVIVDSRGYKFNP